MSNFFDELKRRKVYRVAIAYAIAAWLVIQICATIFPPWELPLWALRLVIVLVLAGFPFALILAWAFDLTSRGIEKTSAPPVASPEAAPRKWRGVYLLGVLGAFLALGVSFFVMPRASARRIEKSIAVLPFENLSDDSANAHFADGIHDDILTNLSKLGDLKVISRTSVMPYRGKSANVREIGKALGVSTVLEGSVRRSGDRVRVNVQLINAKNDDHIWGEVYEREMTEIFAIQSDLSREIAAALQMKLSPGDRARIAKRPTENGEAYLLYLQAHDLFTRPERLPGDLKRSAQLYEKAIQLDPQFALAYAHYSQLLSWVYHQKDPGPENIDKARWAAREALRLQPNLAEAHLAQGYCHYYGDRDYKNGLREFEVALHGLPNDAEALLAIGAIKRREGKWEECIRTFEKALQLDPKNVILWQNLALAHIALRNFEAAMGAYDRAIAAIGAEEVTLQVLRAKLIMEWKGDSGPIKALMKDAPMQGKLEEEILLGRIWLSVLENKPEEGLRLLRESPRTQFQLGGTRVPKAFFFGQLHDFLRQPEEARPYLEEAKDALEKLVAERPHDPGGHARLGYLYAALGRKDDALREGRRAMEIMPVSRDALDGAMFVTSMAQILVRVGEYEQALDILEQSITMPAGVTVQELQREPLWEGLRSHPRFQELLRKHGAKI